MGAAVPGTPAIRASPLRSVARPASGPGPGPSRRPRVHLGLVRPGPHQPHFDGRGADAGQDVAAGGPEIHQPVLHGDLRKEVVHIGPRIFGFREQGDLGRHRRSAADPGPHGPLLPVQSLQQPVVRDQDRSQSRRQPPQDVERYGPRCSQRRVAGRMPCGAHPPPSRPARASPPHCPGATTRARRQGRTAFHMARTGHRFGVEPVPHHPLRCEAPSSPARRTDAGRDRERSHRGWRRAPVGGTHAAPAREAHAGRCSILRSG